MKQRVHRIFENLKQKAAKLLDKIHKNLLEKAQKSLKDSTTNAKNWGDLVKGIREKKLIKANFCGETECEDWIKDKTGGATSRFIDLEEKPKKESKCVHCNKPAKYITYFSKSY